MKRTGDNRDRPSDGNHPERYRQITETQRKSRPNRRYGTEIPKVKGAGLLRQEGRYLSVGGSGLQRQKRTD